MFRLLVAASWIICMSEVTYAQSDGDDQSGGGYEYFSCRVLNDVGSCGEIVDAWDDPEEGEEPNLCNLGGCTVTYEEVENGDIQVISAVCNDEGGLWTEVKEGNEEDLSEECGVKSFASGETPPVADTGRGCEDIIFTCGTGGVCDSVCDKVNDGSHRCRLATGESIPGFRSRLAGVCEE